jgi:DNA replicative helicase MCM subunit Mcm2 (Cdc46/Mcm family)
MTKEQIQKKSEQLGIIAPDLFEMDSSLAKDVLKAIEETKPMVDKALKEAAEELRYDNNHS